jgi:hypothetical protein
VRLQLVLFIQRRLRYKQSRFMKTVLWLKCSDELVEYPPNDEVMKLEQAEGQRLHWRRCRIDIKGAPTCKSRSQAMVQIPCSS